MDCFVLEEIRQLAHPKNRFGGWCFKSKENIGKKFGRTRMTIHRILNKLEARGLIERNEHRMIRCTLELEENKPINAQKEPDYLKEYIELGHKMFKVKYIDVYNSKPDVNGWTGGDEWLMELESQATQ